MGVDFNENDIEMLRKRALLFQELGKIQSANGLSSLSVLQYYAKHLSIGIDTLTDKVRKKLVSYAKEGEEHITKTVHEIANKFGIDKSGEDGFCSMIMSEGILCDYFLDHKTDAIIKKISSYNVDDKIYNFVKDIYPEFDFDKFFRDYTY